MSWGLKFGLICPWPVLGHSSGSRGEPNPPVVVPLEVSGLSKVKFTITTHLVYGDGRPAPDLVTHYEGTVSKSGLLLSTPELSGSTPTLLKRRNSYWQ
jgi:hypothetical protein